MAEKNSPSPSPVYRFGVFQANLAARELRKHGVRVRLPGQPFCILSMLLEKPGEVVTREEMRQRLWTADTFVDFEHSLNTAMKKLRAALGDSPENSRYVETVPRLGYRFIAPVEEISANERPAVETSGVAVNVERAVKTEEPRHRRGPLLLGIPAVLITVVAGYFAWSRPRVRPLPEGGRLMFAVLPFENLTGDSGQDYFSDGLTEEMIAQLGHLDPEHLGVIARTSVMHYKHRQEQLQQIGRDLAVQYVLEGSVRRDSGKVRISAQLVQMKDQTPVWSRQYDRELSGLLALQGEIAQEIADEIQPILGSDHKRITADRKSTASPSSYEAYDLYLKGRYFWNKRTKDSFQQAAEYFQQAIAKDPNYAQAYAGLADTFGLMSTWSLVPQNEFMPKAREAALKALRIDASVAEAHTSLALVAENYDYDWQTAEKEFRQAIQLDPGYGTAHQWYAECLSFQGRFDEALAESERARQLDPLSVIIARDHGTILYFSRQYDRAIEQFRAVREMDPDFPRTGALIEAHVQKGQFATALAELGNPRTYGDATWHWAYLAYICGRAGQLERARHQLEKLEKLSRHEQVDPVTMSWAHLGMGNKEEALADLEKAYSEHFSIMTTLKVEPAYDALRGDPRFQDLLRRVGLADSHNTAKSTVKP